VWNHLEKPGPRSKKKHLKRKVWGGRSLDKIRDERPWISMEGKEGEGPTQGLKNVKQRKEE